MSFLWPNDDGWPYPDARAEPADVESDVDDDILDLRARPLHLFAGLDPLEREVIFSRYGLDGRPARSPKELHADTGRPRSELRAALSSGLAKLRAQLAE
jgi:hypothetical protein